MKIKEKYATFKPHRGSQRLKVRIFCTIISNRKMECDDYKK